MLMRALLPRRGRGGRSKSWVAQHQTGLARIPNPLYSHADASPYPLRYPVDWAGVQSEKKKNTKPNPNKRFISLETERRPRPWGTLWAGRSAGMGMGCATSPLGKPGKARRLAGRHALPSPTMQGQPGRARVAGYLAATLALKAGPGPLPPHATSNSGAGPPMASASPGGELATLPGVVLAVGGPDHGRRVLRPRPAGAGCRRIFAMDGSCPDGPGHGVAFAPGYCRGARA